MSEIVTVGLDLAKNVFQVRGADAAGRAVPLTLPPTFIQRERDSGFEFCQFWRVGQQSQSKSENRATSRQSDRAA
ncbi:hypothetical protein JJJ17_02090 [Paracoccus caeni]|uniref:Transposase n=1 Tax=Paracoccus caeni TaxID=657651 RepID=A0A934VZD3_9RHOB|nr:hypothetical protein [Paracoccus caeni]MBK4214709.1 hypothetical protein [Paracoccus caeni]